MAEYALEKTRAPGTGFTPHFFPLQPLQPLESVVELAIRAAARGIEPLYTVRLKCPKMTGVNPLYGIIKLKDGVVSSSGREELKEKNR